MEALLKPILRPISGWYRRRLGLRLAKLGLTYHDACADVGIFQQAIDRLPEQMKVERSRRMRRAMDLSSKHTELPQEQWEDPWREYEQVNALLAETQKEHDERKFYSDKWWMPYHLGREVWWSYDTKNAWFWHPDGKKKVSY